MQAPAACRVPPRLAPFLCPGVSGLGVVARSGGALVAWSVARTAVVDAVSTRVLAGGHPTAPAVAVRPAPTEAHADWWSVAPDGLMPIAGGAVLLEASTTGNGLRTVPLDLDGMPRGAPQVIDPLSEEYDDPQRVLPVAAPRTSPVATVLKEDFVDGRQSVVAIRLGADGRPSGPRVVVHGLDELLEGDSAAALADGRLFVVSDEDGGGGLLLQRFGADGRIVGADVVQPPLVVGRSVRRATIAVADDDRLLIAWNEAGESGRGTLRDWAVDPANPAAGVPVTTAVTRSPDFGVEAIVNPLPVAAAASSGGGWTLAWTDEAVADGTVTSAVRLDAAGAAVGAVQTITPSPASPASPSRQDHLVVGGDSLAWVEVPTTSAIPQVRAAPVP
jgi:hypothetical protein